MTRCSTHQPEEWTHMTDKKDLVHHRCGPRHGRRHRQGRPGGWARRGRHRPQPRAGQRCRSARTTTCWPSSSTSPTPPTPKRPCRLAWNGSAASTCWSTTPATSTPGSSRRSPPRTSGPRSRPPYSARYTSPAPCCRSLRAQRSGLVVAISSTAGIVGQEFCTAYAASKFGVEGWIESLAPEVAPFGIRTMLVEPGFFRTELLTPESTQLRRAFDRRLRRAHRPRPSRPGRP